MAEKRTEHTEQLEKLKDDRGRIIGVFSTQSMMKVGTGTTQRRTIQKTYWMVQELDNDRIEVQPLNINYVPSGPKKVLSKEEFLVHFSPEPEFYTYTVYPKMQELKKTVARADRHRSKGEYFSAEFEYGNVLKVDEENIKANFGLGLTYLDRGDTAKASDIFQRLVKLDAAFETEHKHLFNDFGINLRKNEMFDQAVTYYQRALELSQEDENLHYNMARAYFGTGNYEKAVAHLTKSLELNPGLEEASKFLEFIKDKNLA